MRAQLIIFLLFISKLLNADTIDYGLTIQAFPAEESEFSSLILEEGKPLLFKKELTLSFDMYVREDNVFGLVLRTISNKNENIDLIFTPSEDNKRYPMLVVNEAIHRLSHEIVCNKWISLSITYSATKGEITLLYDTTRLTIPYNLGKNNGLKIGFGKSLFDKFKYSEIASVNLRNIRIFQDNELTRFWKLEKHNHTICYDSLKQSKATIVNPHWLIDTHVVWEKLYSGDIPENTLFAFNPEKSEFYIVPGSKEVQIFNADQKKIQVIPVEGGILAANAPNQLIYDSRKKELLAYNLDEKIHSVFSFATNRWKNETQPTLEHRYWNNTVCYQPEDSTIISFGGYGYYKYTNDLIKLKPYNNKIDSIIKLSSIYPRYASASVIVDNTLYIFGGRGCKSGRQELYPKYLYDLYAVNLITFDVQKIWETTDVQVDFLPGENLYYDKNNDCFYLFANKEKGALLKIDIHKPTFEQISMPVGEDMEAHYVYSNLYYSPKNNKLYVLINKTKADKSSTFSIYSITFPPIPINDLYQQKGIGGEQLKFRITYLLSAIALLIIIAGGCIIFKKRKRKQYSSAVPEDQKAIPTTVFVNKSKQTTYYDFSRQSICLLGGFSVKDKNGVEITDQFTPMLKQLLFMIILFTVKDKKGINGHELIQYLWFDKSEESAKNNRNVYLSKLRVLLEKVGDVEIASKNGSWTITFGPDICCDYQEAMYYFSEIMNEDVQSRENLDKLLELLLRGTLLPNNENDWIDNFKSDFSNQTIDLLTKLLKDERWYFDNDFKLKIAETIFRHDYLNEEALSVRCSLLFNSGKKGLAKNVYNNFCKEYNNLLGTNYKPTLSDIIGKKTE